MPLVRPEIKSAFVLAFLSALAATYFLNTPLPLFLTRLQQIGLTGVVLWSAGGYGRRCFRDTQILTPLEAVLFSLALGCGVLSSGMILLGVFQLWLPAGARVLLLGGAALSGPFLKDLKSMLVGPADKSKQPPELIAASAVLAGSLLSLLLALTPITYYDSLVYHLALPAAYVQAGRWVALPHLIYSAFPQMLEMLWTLALLVGNDIVVNLVGWSLGLMLLAAVVAFAKRFLSASAGWVAAALLALMPAYLLLASGGYVDIGLALFSFLALYTACIWMTTPAPALLWCSGLFAGSAMGIKYTGALSALLTALLLVWHVWKIRSRQGLVRVAAIFGGGVLLTAGPWAVKNILYVGNPVFPFLRDWGLRAQNPWFQDAAAGYFAGITEYNSRTLTELPALIWETAVNGIGFGRGIDVLGDFGWLPLLGFLPALWLCRKRPVIIFLLMTYCALFFLPWAMSHPVLRFLLPIAPLLALLAGYAWVEGVRPQPALLRWMFRGFMAIFLLSGLFLFFYIAHSIGSFRVSAGLESPQSFLRRKVDYYGAAAFVNQLPADSYTYVFGDQRGYYYERKIWVSPVFSRNRLMDWANTATSAAGLLDALKHEGFTHLLVNRVEHERLKSYPFYTFNDRGQKNWDRLQKQLTRLYHDPACDVYAL